MEQTGHRCLVVIDLQGNNRGDELVGILEMLFEKIEDEVSRLGIVRIVHGYLSEKVLQAGIYDRECA